ncbi:hypothetical protein EV356DRAFT_457845, partial [Viridothelium virens]
LKHINIAYYYIEALWRAQRITVEFVLSSNIIINRLIKPKTGPSFQKFVQQLRLTKY